MKTVNVEIFDGALEKAVRHLILGLFKLLLLARTGFNCNCLMIICIAFQLSTTRNTGLLLTLLEQILTTGVQSD